MYFVIEHIDQLKRLEPKESCYVHVVAANDHFHPQLSSASLVYYNDLDKGYMLVVDHPEGLSLGLESVKDFLKSHSKVYVLDKKRHSYFLDNENLTDLMLFDPSFHSKFTESKYECSIHSKYGATYGADPELGKYIPISKHYEKCESQFKAVEFLIDLNVSDKFEEQLVAAYKFVESSGLRVNRKLLNDKYKLTSESWSLQGEFLYSYYNLYNLTGRPTNAFNGVNFLAIPKGEGFRDCFVPRHDLMVEFDFDAYHLRLASKLIGYEMSKESMHTVLGREYFGKEDLTEDEYKKSKEITFQMLYGGVNKKYKDVKFFSLLERYIDEEWQKYVKFGGINLPTGRFLKKDRGMNKLKLFNYVMQNAETKVNVEKILCIKDYLKDKKTSLVLITYDSFLFDFSTEDGKEVLYNIKRILEKDGLIVKHKYGKTYDFSKK